MRGRSMKKGEWRRGLDYGDLENFINTHVGISFVYKLSVAFLTATATGVASQRGGGVEEDEEEEDAGLDTHRGLLCLTAGIFIYEHLNRSANSNCTLHLHKYAIAAM